MLREVIVGCNCIVSLLEHIRLSCAHRHQFAVCPGPRGWPRGLVLGREPESAQAARSQPDRLTAVLRLRARTNPRHSLYIEYSPRAHNAPMFLLLDHCFPYRGMSPRSSICASPGELPLQRILLIL